MEPITDSLIKQRIEATSRDQYGQIKIINCTPSALFQGRESEVIEHLKSSVAYKLDTYGWKYGTYKAITRR
jgi:hypothetical protein